MENNSMIQVFESTEFGKVRTVVVNDEPWFIANDVCEALNITNRNRAMQEVDDEDKGYTQCVQTLGGKQTVSIINESGIYTILLKLDPSKAKARGVSQEKIDERMATLKRFKRWVTSDVLPTIRKTGGYVANEDLFISTYLPHADEATKLLFKTTLNTMRSLDKENAVLKSENADLKDEVEHKENVIIGLVEDIDLAEKRQRIVQIIRRGRVTAGAIKARWALLYSEFEKKYHVNLTARLERLKSIEIKNRMDLIDKNMNMIPQLFEICCKLYENDYQALMKTWESTIKPIESDEE